MVAASGLLKQRTSRKGGSLKATNRTRVNEKSPEENDVQRLITKFRFDFSLMVVQRAMTENKSVGIGEASMERSKSFVKALQELKNLSPQLYSAADYCEKSYLNSEQKQMVLDNLKDYALQTLVNAIDHLGTVAYKLSDLLEQQTLDLSCVELKVTCLNQRLLMCQTYTEKEGLRQQQVLAIIPRHHKHYTLPSSLNKKVHFNPHIQTDPKQAIQARTRLYSQGASAAKTLSWHLAASETKSTLKGSPRNIIRIKNPICKVFFFFFRVDGQVNSRMKSPPASAVAMQTLDFTRQEFSVGSKPLTPYRSFTNTPQREIARPPARSKSMLSAFFVKQKSSKVKSSS
ncbi:Protein ABIL1 [Striga hermonthica]|uniref:Protein ABIL1 n=1 Tax=Striga hermonthica TaxID=68872 RepID=A0A9N7NIP7_STRHE|nr:Protein ABIL1 [Striga hermonthica]